MKNTIILLIIFLLIPGVTLAWEDCPYESVNCTYPGDCGRYIDSDNDGICDYSQPSPGERNNINETAADDKSHDLTTTSNKSNKRVYHFVPISLILIILYCLSILLVRKKVIGTVKHRKIWNALLLISFLISAILGILLIIKINYGLVLLPLPSTLFWHVEAGIVMLVVSIFHILWYWNYFKNIFKLNK